MSGGIVVENVGGEGGGGGGREFAMMRSLGGVIDERAEEVEIERASQAVASMLWS